MSKKTSAFIRLIISLLAVVLLTILLIMGISGRSLFGLGLSVNFGTKYSNADKYSAGNAKFPVDDLTDIRINWIDGEVNVLPCDGSDIEIEETSDSSLSEKEKVHYYYDKGILYIQYKKSEKGFIFGITNNHEKDKSLTLRIPKIFCGSISSFELDTASSQNDIRGLSCADMDIDNVSGETILTDVEVTNMLDIDNVSGEINLQGTYQQIEIDTVSGSCSIDTDITPSSFNLDTVSGDCEIILPFSSEFSAEIDSVSGDIDFRGFNVTKDDDTYICGSGGNELDFDTVSGDVTVIQKEQEIDGDNQTGDDSQDSSDIPNDDDSQGYSDSESGNDTQGNGSTQSDNDSPNNNGSQGNGYGNGLQNGNGNNGQHGYGHHVEDH